MSDNYLVTTDDIKDFFIENNVLGTIVGFTIAYSAWGVIQSLVGDVILPAIYFTIFRFARTSFVNSIFEPVNKINLANFVKEIISFWLVLMIVYFAVVRVLKKWNKPSNEFIHKDTQEKKHGPKPKIK
jgi:large-conductance mechanosensitive channel